MPGRLTRLFEVARTLGPRGLIRTASRVESVAESTREFRRDLRAIQESLTKLATAAAAAQLRTEQLVTLHRQDTKNRHRMARVDRVLDAERVRVHVEGAIGRGELYEDPFPHMVVTDLLPPKVYEAVVSAIPPRIFFEDRPVNKQQLTVPPDFAPAYSVSVWEFVTECVARQAMGPAVVQRFRAPLDSFVGKICPSLRSIEEAGIEFTVSDGRILLRRPGYIIHPHRDPQWGFLTCIVYLARPDDSVAYGTQLYRLKVEHEPPDNRPFYVDSARCELVKTVPFSANTALVFLNSSGAHGASIPPEAPADLERYIYQFRIGPGAEAVQALLARMPERTRHSWDGGEELSSS